MEAIVLDRESDNNEDLEKVAFEELDALLEDPENSFLTEIPQNIERIEGASSAVESLRIAKELILKRLERTFEFSPLFEVEGVEVISANVEQIHAFMERVKKDHTFVGEGGDALVVMADNDIMNLPPELCYKIAKSETIKRGRNSLAEEAKIHEEVMNLAAELVDSKIGIPTPHYVSEIGNSKIFAMEKLPAKSVDDIMRGQGSVPEWLDIDEFCAEIKKLIDHLHLHGIYHRDLHVGNVMVRQSIEAPEDGTYGYMIDFGLSGYGQENMDPYRRESAGETFTYRDDYAIVSEVKKALSTRRNRTLGE